MTAPADEYLLAALRIAAGADPVPGRVSADARAAFALRLPGGIAAAPMETTAMETTAMEKATGAGVRSTAYEEHGEPAAHRYAAAGLTIDVEPVVMAGRVDVAGQVSPAPGVESLVEVRTPRITAGRVPAEDGRFVVTGLPLGWISVVCHRPGHPPVFTRWLHVRP
ncbi:hypothetical protein [Sphaerimonospora thailandensis]|uniref:Uncharacterized protein n=1 Tax=Sphaerimonospora thailandensis TaxID=795644 RepID=A0A8J3RB71_9ACTN|nr:hypothetical protein [Sphaerimonospora thailandensis]GIH71650.1 hypothetical protein Mth01_39030 [Sphaerimonospora thailandensis]